MPVGEITCGWIDEFGNECGQSASPADKITLRDRLMAGKVIVCPLHKSIHNRRAAEIRSSLQQKKKNRH